MAPKKSTLFKAILKKKALSECKIAKRYTLRVRLKSWEQLIPQNQQLIKQLLIERHLIERHLINNESENLQL